MLDHEPGPHRPRDSIGLAVKATEVALTAATAAGNLAVGNVPGAITVIGSFLMRTANSKRAGQKDRAASLDKAMEAARTEAKKTLEDVERKVDELHESVHWLHENYMTTTHHGRAEYLRNAITNLVTGSEEEVWASLIARVVTEMAPIEAAVLMQSVICIGKVPAEGTVQPNSFHKSIFEKRVVEEILLQEELVFAAFSSLVSRGLLEVEDEGARGKLFISRKYMLTEFGVRTANLLADPPANTDAASDPMDTANK